MPVLSEQQQNAPSDWGNVDQERDAVRRHKPSGNMSNKKKKQARWSLGRDRHGRRMSFGFRDENAQNSFTTPTRDRSNKYKGDSADAEFGNNVDTNFGDIDDNDFENTDRSNHRQQAPLQTPNTAMKRKIMMSLKEAQNSDFYKLLGITKNASPTEIKRAYHKLSFAYHPDKAGRGGNGVGVEITSPEDTTAMFTLIAKAHEVLSDPVERATYDMVEGFQKSTGENLDIINKKNKEDAERAIQLMKHTYKSIVEREKKCHGIIIKEARYGAIPTYVRKDKSIRSQCLHVPTIDVKIPVQCQVDPNSKLYINAGESKRWCSGFYDPIGRADSNTERNLIVRYKFRGKMHQVIVGDKASLQMPLKAHIYNKKYGNEEVRRKRTSDQHNKQRRGKMSIHTEKGTPEVKSLSKEQTAMKNRRVVMISLLGVAASIAGLLSFSSHSTGVSPRK